MVVEERESRMDRGERMFGFSGLEVTPAVERGMRLRLLGGCAGGRVGGSLGRFRFHQLGLLIITLAESHTCRHHGGSIKQSKVQPPVYTKAEVMH